MDKTQDQPLTDRQREEKARLRAAMIRQRESLSPQELSANSAGIQRQLQSFAPLLNLLASHPEEPVGLYAAFRGEPDILPLAPWLMQAGVRVAFPAVFGPKGHRHLRFGLYDGSLPLAAFLKPGVFGVPEPPESALMPFGHPMSLLIMPGVAFDRQGGRLGFGMGYYDRLIAALATRPLLIGVAHPFQLINASLPMMEHDQRLDHIVLPDGVIDTHCDKMET